jgi:hypothetical protein
MLPGRKIARRKESEGAAPASRKGTDSVGQASGAVLLKTLYVPQYLQKIPSLRAAAHYNDNLPAPLASP